MHNFLNLNRYNTGSKLFKDFFSSKNCCRFIIFSVLLLLTYFFLKLPILSTGDTDLWYHLSGGRYFFDNFKIPQSGFFSFMAEQREWSNYYWLFQAVVYQIHKLSGYYGLIIFKAFIYIFTVSVIACFLFKDEKDSENSFYKTVIFICLCIALIPRYYALMRPHMFSYLFIPACIYMLEFRPRYIFLLPLISVIWANSHGVEYPVLVLICLAYFIELYVMRLKNKQNKEIIFYMGIIAFTLCAILINPYFNELLTAPFDFAKNQYQYIKEIRPLSLNETFSFTFFPTGRLPSSLMNLFIILVCIGAIKGLLKRNIRISHFLMFIGGMYLLTRSERFQYEAVLLSLPIVRYQTLTFEKIGTITTGPVKNLSVAVITVVLSFLLLFNFFNAKAKYPFSESNFPRGVTAFLNNINTGGSILNWPDYGGYLQWELSPKYKIAMDLQMVLFGDEDYFKILSALNTKDGLDFFRTRYNPEYIIAYRNNKNFKDMIKDFPAYKSVFFDSEHVLYANIELLPELVKQHELRIIDPYNIMEEDIDSFTKEKTDNLLNELMRIHQIYPEGMLTNFQIGRIFKKRKDYSKARKHADTIINNFPEQPYGYTLKGDILKDEKLYDDSISLYKKALKCPVKWSTQSIYKKLAIAYSKIDEHKKAYRNMKKAVQAFSPSSDYNDIWMLGNMAILCGEFEDGVMYLKFSMIKAPKEDKDFIKRVQKQLDKIR